MTTRLLNRNPFPSITLTTTDGHELHLDDPGWRAVFVVRGAHCGMCRMFLGQLETKRRSWNELGIDVVVVTADPTDVTRRFMSEAGYTGPAAGGLTVADMQSLELYMTGPDVSGLDHVHPEPGFFLIDPDGLVAAAEVSNLPVVRPDLATLDQGFRHMIEGDVRPPFGRFHLRPPLRGGETVLVTGATGYIGSVVVERLQSAGYRVRGLTRSTDKADMLREKSVDAFVGTVDDADVVGRAAQGVGAIVHTAAASAPAPDPELTKVVADAVAAIRTLDAAATANDARLIITSGTSVYGPTGGATVDETTAPAVPPPLQPLVEVERQLVDRGSAHVLRSSVVYGRHQSEPTRDMISNLKTRGTVPSVGGENRLSVVHVDDLAELFVLLLEADTPPPIVNGVGSMVPWKELLTTVGRIAGVESERDAMAADEIAAAVGGLATYAPIDMAVSGELARRSLGWRPTRHGIDRGLIPT